MMYDVDNYIHERGLELITQFIQVLKHQKRLEALVDLSRSSKAQAAESGILIRQTHTHVTTQQKIGQNLHVRLWTKYHQYHDCLIEHLTSTPYVRQWRRHLRVKAHFHLLLMSFVSVFLANISGGRPRWFLTRFTCPVSILGHPLPVYLVRQISASLTFHTLPLSLSGSLPHLPLRAGTFSCLTSYSSYVGLSTTPSSAYIGQMYDACIIRQKFGKCRLFISLYSGHSILVSYDSPIVWSLLSRGSLVFVGQLL